MASAARLDTAINLFTNDIAEQIVRNRVVVGDADAGLCAGVTLHLCCNPCGNTGGSGDAKSRLVECALTAIGIVAFFAFVIAYIAGREESAAATKCREAREELEDLEDNCDPGQYKILASKLKAQHYAHNTNTLCAAVAAVGAALLLTAAIIALCSLEYQINYDPTNLAIGGAGVTGGAIVVGTASYSYASSVKISNDRYAALLTKLPAGA